MLKPLLLPQLVEERRKRESLPRGYEMDLDLSSTAYNTQNSSASDLHSPLTPTSSIRGHLRYSSSVSSIDVPVSISECPSSPPSFTLLKTGKRSLPDVKEEKEREEHDDLEEIFESSDDDELYDCFCDDRQCGHRDSSMAQSSVQLSSRPDFDFDLCDGFFSDGEVDMSQRLKKRREGESPFAAMATRLGTRFPSFSRKWRLRKEPGSVAVIPDRQRSRANSRTASSRSSSVSTSFKQEREMSPLPQLPLSPARSREEITAIGGLDLEPTTTYEELDREQQLAATPLLPPLMVDTVIEQPVVQSPLQSPSVAEANDPFSGTHQPIDALTTPQLPGMPTPPLSTKPSTSSFHRVHNSRPGYLVPASEIPAFMIVEEHDEWALKLGHANFTVQPEPYLPATFDIEACRKLRADWDSARTNYTKHLVRTGEHYGVTSKTYALTEEKWAQTDARWKAHNETTIQHTVDCGNDAFATLKHNTFGGNSADGANLMTRIPSLNDPHAQGKFPQLGDGDIVGPMFQAAAVSTTLQRTPSKKAKIMKFFAEKFPVGLSR